MSPYSLILFLICAHTLVSAVTDVDFQLDLNSEVSNTDQLLESGSNNLYFAPDTATARKNERHFPYSLRFKENFQAESSQSGCFIYKLKKGWKKADCSYQGLSSIADLHFDDPGSISVLDLTGNNVETIPMGVWTEYSGLKYLILSINNLTRLENNSFWGLSKLKRLDLQGNYVAMTKENVPESVFQPLTSLRTLRLENNTHSKLSTPETYPHWALAHISSLKNLYIDGFRDQKFGVGFRNMTSLRYLSLSGYNGRCYLGHLKNDTFEHLGQLERLMMRRCGIHAHGIDKGVLGPFTKLQRLDVSRNVDINLDVVVSAMSWHEAFQGI
ncbi:toll-like receptor e [Plakobranchus ocellatus]|uniref:Toll-like receptor e n=1 Tax=Plakobranchus ocellatus TaxID=259542 RepID=A0AAV4AZX8_9GAST|nr:toll-like receptor e [Plakobranchus ocellatus]